MQTNAAGMQNNSTWDAPSLPCLLQHTGLLQLRLTAIDAWKIKAEHSNAASNAASNVESRGAVRAGVVYQKRFPMPGTTLLQNRSAQGANNGISWYSYNYVRPCTSCLS